MSRPINSQFNKSSTLDIALTMTTTPVSIGNVADFRPHLGICVKVSGRQIAVFYLPDTQQQWFAIDNFNPQNQRMVLSRGITGDQDGEPFVACPLHRYRYSLIDGKCLTDETYKVSTYLVELDNGTVILSV